MNGITEALRSGSRLAEDYICSRDAARGLYSMTFAGNQDFRRVPSGWTNRKTHVLIVVIWQSIYVYIISG